MRYGIILYDGVEPIDVGATFGVLSMAKRRVPDLTYCGVASEPGPIRCANGLVVEAEYGFASCPPVETLIVTGGPGWQDASTDATMLDFLRQRSADGATKLASICTGAMILAASGALDGQMATTKTAVFDGEIPPLSLLAQRDTIATTDQRLVESDGIVTSGGVTLGIDAMFRLLQRDYGEAIARDVARVMEYDRALAANGTL